MSRGEVKKHSDLLQNTYIHKDWGLFRKQIVNTITLA